MKNIINLMFRPMRFLNCNADCKNTLLTHLLLIVTIIVDATIFSKLHLYSFITLYMILMMSIGLQIVIIYFVLKIIRISAVKYTYLSRYLFSTAYLGYSVWTLIYMPISIILPDSVKGILQSIIELYKLYFIYQAIKLQYTIDEKQNILLIFAGTILFFIPVVLT